MALSAFLGAGPMSGALMSGALMAAPPGATSQPAESTVVAGLIRADEWAQYRDRFIISGRVVDNANGDITHSESQGYGMMLAVMADDSATFSALWGFVRSQMMVRDDGLTAWRWHPATRPHVTDINNATDGDILIAGALLLGANAWEKPELAAAARTIMNAVAGNTVIRAGGQTLLLPGVEGFHRGARPDAPVINPSYWVFEALALFAKHRPQQPVWQKLTESGLMLIDHTSFGPAGAPSEWVSVRDAARPRPAAGFNAEYGYNALRIPLYLMRAGIDDRPRLARFRKLWSRNGQHAPAIIDIHSGRSRYDLDDSGYAMIVASLDCALDGTPIPETLRRFSPALYYPSTLHLLGLSLVRQRYPQCL
ncbi:glycosyl hydrolase family 8 [Pseudochelatococcus contaminans]|uniref:cellulase n=1 Tax=Pseudochelatococcus contaminans TaxID=1538103 RepID=A0A7W5Z543_9HYPH|nr:glycosyl hydrolase family 8 [Pseudochelatococcus contaminans]MBB3810149.1 endoglucanase [Pseudochelatococcus contaminans]